MNSSPSKLPLALFAVPVAMLLLALGPLPYGYYQLLRLVVAIAGAWIATSAWQDGKRTWPIVLGITALTFNPIFPLHFDRGVWSVLNIIGALVFAASGWALGERRPRAR